MKRFVFIFLFFNSMLALSQTLKVGFLTFAPPFSDVSGEGHHFFGFNVELMDAICQRIKARCIYKPITSVTQQSDLLNQGIIDLSFAPNLIIKGEPSNYIFSLPYIASDGQFITLKTNVINSLKDIKNKKIGVIETTYYKALQQTSFARENRIIKYTTVTDLFDALTSSDIDVLMINHYVAKYLINTAERELVTVGNQVPLGDGYGLVAAKKNAPIIDEINNALLGIEADGTYLSIYNGYFGQLDSR